MLGDRRPNAAFRTGPTGRIENRSGSAGDSGPGSATAATRSSAAAAHAADTPGTANSADAADPTFAPHPAYPTGPTCAVAAARAAATHTPASACATGCRDSGRAVNRETNPAQAAADDSAANYADATGGRSDRSPCASRAGDTPGSGSAARTAHACGTRRRLGRACSNAASGASPSRRFHERGGALEIAWVTKGDQAIGRAKQVETDGVSQVGLSSC